MSDPSSIESILAQTSKRHRHLYHFLYFHRNGPAFVDPLRLTRLLETEEAKKQRQFALLDANWWPALGTLWNL